VHREKQSILPFPKPRNATLSLSYVPQVTIVTCRTQSITHARLGKLSGSALKCRTVRNYLPTWGLKLLI